MSEMRKVLVRKQKDGSKKSGKALTVIAHGTSAKGRFEVAGEIVIHGTFEGDIVSSASLTVGRTGVVDATVASRQIYIDGSVRGTLHAGAAYLDSQARLVGEVHTPFLRVAEGAVLQGFCSMPDRLDELAREVIPLQRSGS